MLTAWHMLGWDPQRENAAPVWQGMDAYTSFAARRCIGRKLSTQDQPSCRLQRLVSLPDKDTHLWQLDSSATELLLMHPPVDLLDTTCAWM
jgi:hypothetical protein